MIRMPRFLAASSTGPIFLQCGRLDGTAPGLTLGEYATLGGRAIGSLLDLLNAAAEAEQFARRSPGAASSTVGSHARRERTPPIGSIGYTGSYREPSPDVVDVSVISVLEAQGPE